MKIAYDEQSPGQTKPTDSPPGPSTQRLSPKLIEFKTKRSNGRSPKQMPIRCPWPSKFRWPCVVQPHSRNELRF